MYVIIMLFTRPSYVIFIFVYQAQLGDEVPKGGGVVNINNFRVGMKLEAKDRLNPSLVCVATITDIRNGQLLIHFDGWTNRYDYWCRPDTTDIHPVGWCKRHGKELQKPKGQYT